MNISRLVAFEYTQAAPQSSCLNDVALLNMLSMLVTLDTSQCEMSPLNDGASQNIPFISVTLDTSHFEISPEKCEKANISLISVMADISHSPIGPLGPVEQSPSEDRLIHASIAFLSSDSNRGENTDLLAMATEGNDVLTICIIDPGESANIRFFFAFEWIQAAPRS